MLRYMKSTFSHKTCEWVDFYNLNWHNLWANVAIQLSWCFCNVSAGKHFSVFCASHSTSRSQCTKFLQSHNGLLPMAASKSHWCFAQRSCPKLCYIQICFTGTSDVRACTGNISLLPTSTVSTQSTLRRADYPSTWQCKADRENAQCNHVKTVHQLCKEIITEYTLYWLSCFHESWWEVLS